jgi:hypothetical protein
MRGRPRCRPSAAVTRPAADDVLPARLRSRRVVLPLAVGRQRSGTNIDHARDCDGSIRQELATPIDLH